MPELPVVFLAHGGGPLPILGAQPEIAEHLRDIPSLIPGGQQPKAILVISAHWEEKVATVNTAENPGLLFDYGGFPPETYKYVYPCQGAVGVAERVKELLRAQNIAVNSDSNRGLDHGVFIPLLLAYPQASIPVTQLSLLASLDPKEHLLLGAALRPLRSEGVLILCSGLSFHNMSAFFSPKDEAKISQGREFDQWLNKVMTDQSNTAASDTAGLTLRERALIDWKKAPGALFCHPREEHLVPIIVCAGAGGAGRGTRIFHLEREGEYPFSAFAISD